MALLFIDNLRHWKEYATPLKAKDFNWSQGHAFASKVIESNLFTGTWPLICEVVMLEYQ
jgi:hypothetical protein